MKKVLVTAWAISLACVWTIGPGLASAQDKAETTKDKLQSTGEKTKDKLRSAGEKTKDKLQSAGETTKDKLQSAGETAKDKLQSAGEKTKEKLTETKDKIKEKVHRDKTSSARSARPSSSVRSAQQALMDKGYNPGPVDGRMGPKTMVAIRDFQKAEGMKATGRLDTTTAMKLGVAGKTADTSPSAAPDLSKPSASGPTETSEKTPASKRQEP